LIVIKGENQCLERSHLINWMSVKRRIVTVITLKIIVKAIAIVAILLIILEELLKSVIRTTLKLKFLPTTPTT